MRIQKRAKYPRKQVSARVNKEIERKIEQLARVNDCSKSFVQNTLLADALGIDTEERYDDNR